MNYRLVDKTKKIFPTYFKTKKAMVEYQNTAIIENAIVNIKTLTRQRRFGHDWVDIDQETAAMPHFLRFKKIKKQLTKSTLNDIINI